MPTIISDVVTEILNEGGIVHPDADVQRHLERHHRQKKIDHYSRKFRKDDDKDAA